MAGPGILVCVIGPAGSGKNAIIDGARLRLGEDGRFVFPRRFITRPPEAGGENHVAITPERFLSLCEAGALSLTWERLGVAYGLPAGIEDDIRRGALVVVKIPAIMVPEAKRRFPRVLVLEITAGIATLSRRLMERGHEGNAHLQMRLGGIPDSAIGIHATILNDGDGEQAVTAFVAALKRGASL